MIRVQSAIDLFPPTFGLKAFPGEVFRISETASYINDNGVVILYSQRLIENRWVDFAKGRVCDFRREVI